MIEGLVLGGTNNSFAVECDDGVERLCPIKGKVLRESEGYYNPLAPGDRVSVEPDAHDQARGQVISLSPRRNRFVRLNQKGNLPQLIAANIDLLVCVTTPDEPPFRPRFVDRALVQADAEGIPAAVVLNKADLGIGDDARERLEDWVRLGYSVLRVSAASGDGIDGLRSLIAGRSVALVGQSGVGKSSILNALRADLALRTGCLSEKYGRGTHTTTRGSLYRVPAQGSLAAASVVDTPGVRRFVPHGIAARDLALHFPEMAGLVGSCSFGASCTHTHEPGCKILEAVYAGVIHEERYDSWARIREEIETGSWTD